MSEETDLNKALKDVKDRLETIIRRLDNLEDLLAKYPEILELAELMHLLGIGARLSSEPVKAIHRLLSLRRIVEKPGLDLDDTSTLIIQVLALRGASNISQITREIRNRKGKASRKTIRKRIRSLLDQGIIRRAEGYKFSYELSE